MEQENQFAQNEWQPPPPPEGLPQIPGETDRTGRYIAVGAIGVGVIVVVLGFAGIVPVLTSAGGMLILFGMVWFGLSFIPFPVVKVNDEPPMSVIESLTKIFYAPTEVFQNLRKHPRWFAALLIVTLLSSAYLYAFTERVTAKRIVDHVIEKTEQIGFQIPSEQITKMRQDQMEQLTNPVAKVGSLISGFAGLFVSYALLAAIYLLIVLIMGGNIKYWQSFAAVVYSFFPVMVIRYVLSLIILLIKDPADIHPLLGQHSLVQDNLGALLNPAASPILWALLTGIGILSFYWLWLTATSLKNAGESVTASAAWTSAVVVWVLALAFGILSAALFPGFVS